MFVLWFMVWDGGTSPNRVYTIQTSAKVAQKKDENRFGGGCVHWRTPPTLVSTTIWKKRKNRLRYKFRRNAYLFFPFVDLELGLLADIMTYGEGRT